MHLSLFRSLWQIVQWFKLSEIKHRWIAHWLWPIGFFWKSCIAERIFSLPAWLRWIKTNLHTTSSNNNEIIYFADFVSLCCFGLCAFFSLHLFFFGVQKKSLWERCLCFVLFPPVFFFSFVCLFSLAYISWWNAVGIFWKRVPIMKFKLRRKKMRIEFRMCTSASLIQLSILTVQNRSERIDCVYAVVSRKIVGYHDHVRKEQLYALFTLFTRQTYGTNIGYPHFDWRTVFAELKTAVFSGLDSFLARNNKNMT